MARVEPFAALRYDDERVDLARVLSPPLDAVDEKKRAALCAREPRNALSIIARAPGLTVDESRARQALFLAELRRAGVLRRDDAPALYVVKETVSRVRVDEEPATRLGFFAWVTPGTGADVLAHEDVSPQAIVDARADAEPASLAFDDVGGRVMRTLRAEVSERDPDARATVFGESLELFVVDDDTACARVTTLLEDRELFVVDGHHQVAQKDGAPFVAHLTALGDGVSALFALHRVVSLPGFRRDFFVDRAAAFFSFDELARDEDVERVLDEQGPPRAILVDKRGLVLLTLKEDAPLDEVDLLQGGGARRRVVPALLSTIVLDHLLAVDASVEVRYLPSAGAAVDDVAHGEHGSRVALILPRPDMATLLLCAREGARLPPSTTRFAPKVVGGLVFAPPPRAR